jgi:hypothetical protein
MNARYHRCTSTTDPAPEDPAPEDPAPEDPERIEAPLPAMPSSIEGGAHGSLPTLWAYLAEAHVVVHGECRAVTRRIRGMFCARNHREARSCAIVLASEAARRIGRVVEVRLNQVW